MIDFYIQSAVRLYSKTKNCKPIYPLELLTILETNVSCSIPMLMISVGLAKKPNFKWVESQAKVNVSYEIHKLATNLQYAHNK